MHDVWWRAEDAPVVGNDPRWRIEICIEIEAHRAHAVWNTHTHTDILQGTLQTRVLVCDCDGAKFGVHSTCFPRRPADQAGVNGSPDFVPARHHQLVRLPLFLSGRELLFAKSFPPVEGTPPALGGRPDSGANIHWQTSTVRKYTQWDRAVESSIPLKRGEPHVRTIWLTVLCDISS